MATIIRRILTIVICSISGFLFVQYMLTEDVVLKKVFTLHVTQTDPNGRQKLWQFHVDEFWRTHMDGKPATVTDVLARLDSAKGTLELKALDGNQVTSWTASRDAGGQFKIGDELAIMNDLQKRLVAGTTPPANFKPTRPVTIQEVLEANIPMPTRSKVSFPEFSYKQAFPEANDNPEIVINEFDEALMLKYLRDPGSLPKDLPADRLKEWKRNWEQWRQHYPQDLPPVRRRLPRNPAVVVGPDGIGQYGGIWRRCTSSMFDFGTKLCYESFTRHDPSGRIQPALAYKWEVSPDNRVFTFYLRKGHRWSDGHPYTTDDILWVCNTFIGSADIPSPPDWMMATDGSMTLYADDAADWQTLAARIIEQAHAAAPSVGRQIKALAGERLWKNLQKVAAGKGDEDTAVLIAAALNELFRQKSFYNPEAFAEVDLDGEQRELEQIGASKLNKDQISHLLLMMERAHVLRGFRQYPESLEPIELNRMNLLLFRTAYRDLVLPPLKRRVKVEAVPDETGDTSHIFRFTFRKPNCIFLEQTTTFMFYGVFSSAKHFGAPFLVDGWKTLAVTDFCRWEDLWKQVMAEADGPGPAPGKRLWERLAEPIRQKIRAGLPPRHGGENDWLYGIRMEPHKQPVIDAVNEALSKPGFYDPGAWGGFDIQAWKRMVDEGEGFEKISRDRAKLDEFRDLLILEDLLKRWNHDGVNSLGKDDHLQLNMMMFRWAYSRDENSLVARTREDGLNQLAQRHPRRYTSWLALMRDRGNYHHKYNRHTPVLHAWRIVDEKDKPSLMAVRNPYCYRVDAQGNQLPYIDAVRTTISRNKQVRVLKMRSGNVDFQSREIIFEDFTPLKQSEEAGDYQVRLWGNDYCGEVIFNCLQAHKDPMYLKLQEDPNFRYALSLALNRQEMIDIVFAGMGRPAQFSVPEGSPYYNEKMAKAFVEHDPNRASRLLDAMGLDKRNRDGFRLLWDGRPLIMDVNVISGGEVPLQAVRLACHYWKRIGINAMMKYRTGGMIYRLESLGLSDMRVHKEGGNFYGPTPPGAYYPSHSAEAVQWSRWASYMRSGGRTGTPPPERIKELERMWQKFIESPNETEKRKNWKAITDRFARDLPLIGIMTSPGKIILVKNNFRNVPRIAMAGWIAHEPGNSCPECFFFDHNYLKKKE